MPKFEKGSILAKEHMANIRAKRGSGLKKPKMDDIKNDSDNDENTKHDIHLHYHNIDGGKLKGVLKILNKAGRKVAKVAIPATLGALGSIAGETLAPEIAPVSGFAGAQLGKYAGKQINKKLGLGLVEQAIKPTRKYVKKNISV